MYKNHTCGHKAGFGANTAIPCPRCFRERMIAAKAAQTPAVATATAAPTGWSNASRRPNTRDNYYCHRCGLEAGSCDH